MPAISLFKWPGKTHHWGHMHNILTCGLLDVSCHPFHPWLCNPQKSTFPPRVQTDQETPKKYRFSSIFVYQKRYLRNQETHCPSSFSATFWLRFAGHAAAVWVFPAAPAAVATLRGGCGPRDGPQGESGAGAAGRSFEGLQRLHRLWELLVAGDDGSAVCCLNVVSGTLSCRIPC